MLNVSVKERFIWDKNSVDSINLENLTFFSMKYEQKDSTYRKYIGSDLLSKPAPSGIDYDAIQQVLNG